LRIERGLLESGATDGVTREEGPSGPAGNAPARQKRRSLWWGSVAAGLGITLLGAAGTAYLAVAERSAGWLRSVSVALGLTASPFWLAAGILGVWAGGPKKWTMVAAFVVNVALWAAVCYPIGALVRTLRSGPGSRGGNPGAPAE